MEVVTAGEVAKLWINKYKASVLALGAVFQDEAIGTSETTRFLNSKFRMSFQLYTVDQDGEQALEFWGQVLRGGNDDTWARKLSQWVTGEAVKVAAGREQLRGVRQRDVAVLMEAYGAHSQGKVVPTKRKLGTVTPTPPPSSPSTA